MKWWNDMIEQEKHNFKKVIAVCIIGTFLILLIPMVFHFSL